MPTKAQVAGYKKKYRQKNKKKFAYWQRIHRYKKSGLYPPHPPPTGCECCGKVLESTTHGACLDHCHLTGLFRGWLCANCNSALGLAGDTPEAVRRLLSYVERAYERINKQLAE